MKKQAVVVYSGGMDSSICLKLACQTYGKEQVLALSFYYGQAHAVEIEQAAFICQNWQVEHKVIKIDFYQQLTTNSLFDPSLANYTPNKMPSSFVMGRNGLMARLAAIQAESVKASLIYMGILELEVANSGYPDCSRHYMDLMEQILRIDLLNPHFQILTPLVNMNKEETLFLAEKLNILEFLLENTVSCYLGFKGVGCKHCPACLLRQKGLKNYYLKKALKNI